MYNPVSMARLAEMAIANEGPPVNSYHTNLGLTFNYHFHSSFSRPEKEDTEIEINKAIKKAHIFLKSADYLFITLGSAWVYTQIEPGEIVSNCHKMPAVNFTKRLLSAEEIVQTLTTMVEQVAKYNSKVRTVFTISPVRHIKDTLEGNAISKARLKTAIYDLCEKDERTDYFPAWEIMMDDLRDYRFYDNDLLHPNSTAIEYLWEKFGERYMSEETREIMGQWQGVRKGLLHRPQNKYTGQYLGFLRQMLKKLTTLSNKININDELRKLQRDIREVERSVRNF